MRRRDLLKALTAIPLLGGVLCCGQPNRKQRQSTDQDFIDVLRRLALDDKVKGIYLNDKGWSILNRHFRALPFAIRQDVSKVYIAGKPVVKTQLPLLWREDAPPIAVAKRWNYSPTGRHTSMEVI